MKSGFIGIVGRPNVGKSTLINSIIGKKIAITSNKPQTTRNIIQGIYNEDKYQMVFVDTPGIHKPNDKLGKNLNDQAYFSITDTDIIMLVVDAYEGLGKGDLFILEHIKKAKKPVFLIINKIDKVDRQKIIDRIIEYKDLYDFDEIIPVSSYTKDNIRDLIDTLKKYLPDNIRYYGENDITNKSIDFLISEIVREKVFNLTEEEVPHSVTCVTESVEVSKTSYNIRVAIIVDRDSLKKIIIGSKGNMIKEIGSSARVDIEKLMGRNIYLELFVKTVKKWREKEKYLQEYGFNDYKS